MRKKLSFILIVIGIGIILYPIATRLNAEKVQEKMLDEYKTEVQQIQEEKESETLEDVSSDQKVISSEVTDSISLDLLPLSTKELNPLSLENEQEEETPVTAYDPKVEAIGVLKIASIDFEQVIMPTASQKDLLISVGHVQGTSWLNDDGNIVIAGHRSKKYGRNFNRLEELKIGDTIYLESNGNSVNFEVTESFIVEPQEVWVLQSDRDKNMITLITCTPLENPTHRYIVRGVVSEQE